MDQVKFRPAKLLIVIVGKYGGALVVEAIKRGGAKGGTRTAGRGMARYFTGGGNADEDVTESLVFSLMHEEADSVMHELIRAGLEDPGHLGGMALVLDATGMARPWMENAEGAPERAGSERMSSGNTLITCIITHGQANEIMALAREAGARGGTILNARGTGTENDVRFFGISLAPEKEMLLIVADNNHAQGILEAVCGLSIFSKPGGGIVYTTNVEQFTILGR